MSADIGLGYKKALELLKECSSEYGFFASPEKRDNYKRVCARYVVISGLASLLTKDQHLIKTFKETLNTLLDYQGRQGEIPSNVSPVSKRVSYGTLAGRVDASLWYIIGCGKYYDQTEDGNFLEDHYPGIKKTIDLLECWEFNQRGLIFVPEGGDWADEMPRRGYLLYDQILYYLALIEFIKLKKIKGEEFEYWDDKKVDLKKRIQINFWPQEVKKQDQKYIYHISIFNELKNKEGRYWMEDFDADTKRFDTFANSLAIISGISDKKKNQKIVEYASKVSKKDLLPAFHPVIRRWSKDWDELKSEHLFEFKNKPYSYHNGGLWPMINGFYILALRKMGEKDLAEHYSRKITQANYLNPKKGGEWGFYEYLDGKKKTPKGTPHMAWNAAAQVFAYKSKRIL